MSSLHAAIGNGAAEALRDLAQTLQRSTVQVQSGRGGGGSGVIWRADGLVITNAHVVRGKRALVELSDGTRLSAQVTASDAERDLASLKVEASGLPAATIGDSDALRPGQLAFAVGNPMGLVGAVTSGIIFAGGAQAGRRARWIQADVRIAPGNSGGPLADARGRVIGVNSMIYGGLAIAVPSNAIVRFLRAQGERPRLGVVVEPVTLRHGKVSLNGLLIVEVDSGSAADRASLLPGDVIVRLAEKPVQLPEDLPDALYASGHGGVLQLELVRGGATQLVNVELGAESGATAAA